ncbi:MAG: hypothetical protein U1F43_11105 [Myxococcota bacterium]
MKLTRFDQLGPDGARARPTLVASGHHLPETVVATDRLGLADPSELVRLTGVERRHGGAHRGHLRPGHRRLPRRAGRRARARPRARHRARAGGDRHP